MLNKYIFFKSIFSEEVDESWEYSLRDTLYTACKTGDIQSLRTSFNYQRTRKRKRIEKRGTKENRSSSVSSSSQQAHRLRRLYFTARGISRDRNQSSDCYWMKAVIQLTSMHLLNPFNHQLAGFHVAGGVV